MLMKKKQLLMATLVIALGAAVAVNWYYTKNPIDITEPTGNYEVSGNLGDALSVDSSSVEGEEVEAQSVMADPDFFTNERLKRDEAYDEIIDGIEEMAEKESLTAEQAEKITSLLDRYARNMKIQSDAESLISAKTGSDCIVVINEEACQVIMEKNTLNDTVILQITEIIEKNTNISAKKLTIIEAK
ncbi:MAG: SpoIIIAH-like family protein [Ruminococcaceae bacterium]|nr:SpoIIIAH-like family protein [Oscillospiraceae bacterium]